KHLMPLGYQQTACIHRLHFAGGPASLRHGAVRGGVGHRARRPTRRRTRCCSWSGGRRWLCRHLMAFVLSECELTRRQQKNRGKKTEIPLVTHDFPNRRERRLIHCGTKRRSGSNTRSLSYLRCLIFEFVLCV